MTKPPDCAAVDFDDYVANYHEVLNRGLALSGETYEYFARGRVAWLARCLRAVGFAPATVLDFGCGVGGTTPLFFDCLGVRESVGVDTSRASLEKAQRDFGGPGRRFCLLEEVDAGLQVDLAYCNGVFHHIPPPERPAALERIRRLVRPGGYFALWENNPWNPGTRIAMRVPFDRDAQPFSIPAARRLVRTAGFHVVRTDSLFFFPRCLKWLRPLEPWLARTPLGAQYQVLTQREATVEGARSASD